MCAFRHLTVQNNRFSVNWVSASFPRLNQTCQCWQRRSLERCPARPLCLTDRCTARDMIMIKEHPVSLTVQLICCLCSAKFCTVCSWKVKWDVIHLVHIYICFVYIIFVVVFCTKSWWQHIIMTGVTLSWTTLFGKYLATQIQWS